MSTVSVPTSFGEIADTMTEKLNSVLYTIDEIAKTNPTVTLTLLNDKAGQLAVVADIRFPEHEHVSPMEFADRLTATELIKVVVNKNFRVKTKDN